MSKAMIWVTEQDGGGFVVHRRASPSANVAQFAMDSLLCAYCGKEVSLGEIGWQWSTLEDLDELDREPACFPCGDFVNLWGEDDDDDYPL